MISEMALENRGKLGNHPSICIHACIMQAESAAHTGWIGRHFHHWQHRLVESGLLLVGQRCGGDPSGILPGSAGVLGDHTVIRLYFHVVM